MLSLTHEAYSVRSVTAPQHISPTHADLSTTNNKQTTHSTCVFVGFVHRNEDAHISIALCRTRQSTLCCVVHTQMMKDRLHNNKHICTSFRYTFEIPARSREQPTQDRPTYSATSWSRCGFRACRRLRCDALVPLILPGRSFSRNVAIAARLPTFNRRPRMNTSIKTQAA